MKTSDFDYYLPEELIAYNPVPGRHGSRLMCVDRSDSSVNHRKFYDIAGLLKPGDLIVLNDTKVIPARLSGRKASGGEVEVLLLEKRTGKVWACMVRGPKDGLKLDFGEGINGKLKRTGPDTWSVEFDCEIGPRLAKIGKMPLPPYIRREADESDVCTYQTVYARKDGAVAAPTAGLHFTTELLSELSGMGVYIKYVTLHVGAGTFLPVKTEDVKEHSMHSEYFEIPEGTAECINEAKSEGRRLIAVGTTVVRTLESAASGDGTIKPGSGRTELFITPGFNFRVVDSLITNFHLPRSTLLMLVSAFAGHELVMKAYETARRHKYRFLSYGDSMFIV